MKRSGTYIIIFSFFITFTMIFAARIASSVPTQVKNTKHNLSTSGSGSYISYAVDSGGTTEICVFCHTPHNATTLLPLWNKTSYGGSYTPYDSDVMTAMGYTEGDSSLGTGLKHMKTRVCLSCHDGTIALGNLANLPNGLIGDPDEIPILNTSGGPPDELGHMPQAAAGFIGTDLSDDHPVAIKYYSSSPDPELKAVSENVYLFDDNANKTRNDGDYVECTSCHNAHDNQYGNFLVQTNKQSALCKICHDKKGFTSSVHDDNNKADATYQPPDGTNDGGGINNLAYPGTKVGDVKCMNCHFPHKAGVEATAMTTPITPTYAEGGYYLLTFKEEQSCFNNTNRWGQSVTVCHGSSSTTKNIQTEVGKTNSHDVGSYVNIHRAAEANADATTWSGTKHVECADCHNPHTAGNTPRTVGTNTVTGTSLAGAGGTGVATWPTGWSSPSAVNFRYREPYGLISNAAYTSVTYEYEICFRCHSSANANLTGWVASWTDVAKEFNSHMTSSRGFHPVEGINTSRFPIPDGSFDSTLGFSTTGMKMYCSDCHGSDSLSTPQGAHGSGNASLLRGASFYTSYSNTTGSDESSTDALCGKCHAVSKYYSATDSSGSGFETSGGTNLHNRHAAKKNGFSYRCVNCHTKIPHGYSRRGMIVVQSDTDVATYAAEGAAKITSLSGGVLPAYQTYPTTTGGGTCGTVAGCH